MAIQVKVFKSTLTLLGVWGLLGSTLPGLESGPFPENRVNAQTLPPPPAVPRDASGNPPTRIAVPSTPTVSERQGNRSAPLREYEFKAAPSRGTQTATSNRFPSNGVTRRLYRVEVQGTSAWLLSQVKRIEPQAFARQQEGLIQVGVFQQQQHAEKLVRELVLEGLWARIVTLGSPASPPTWRASQPKRSPRGRSIHAGSGRFRR